MREGIRCRVSVFDLKACAAALRFLFCVHTCIQNICSEVELFYTIVESFFFFFFFVYISFMRKKPYSTFAASSSMHIRFILMCFSILSFFFFFFHCGQWLYSIGSLFHVKFSRLHPEITCYVV